MATNYGAGDEFLDAIESGDQRRTLEAMRRHIAERIADGVAARDLAALTRQLRDITKELEALDGDDEAPSTEDELAGRRAAVVSAAGVGSAAAGG